MSDADGLHEDMAGAVADEVAEAVYRVFGPDREHGREHLEAWLDGRALLRVTKDEAVVLIKPKDW